MGDPLHFVTIARVLFYGNNTAAMNAFLTQLAVAPSPPANEDDLLLGLDAARRWLQENTTVYEGIDSTISGVPRTPTATGRPATGLDLTAFLGAPDQAEFLVFGYTVPDYDKTEVREAAALYSSALQDIANIDDILTNAVDATQLKDVLDEVREEIKSVHEDVVGDIKKTTIKVANAMHKQAINKGALAGTKGDVPRTTWGGAYATVGTTAWARPEEKLAIRTVFERFIAEYKVQTAGGRTTSFDQVYNKLRKSERKILALSTWLVPYNKQRSRPESGTPDYNTFFAQKDGRSILNQIINEDPTLTGKKLTTTISFP